MTKTFLSGPAGAGKTTRATEHLRRLVAAGVPAHEILVLLPQQTLAAPYQAVRQDPGLPGAGGFNILTFNGLALRTIDLFWPHIARPAGFAHPDRQPVFLTIETAQYYIARVIEPLLAEGYFDPNVVPVAISLPRLMTQILDNLNKAALIGLPHTEVGARLASSLADLGEPAARVAYSHAQACANAFREYCLGHNLLDFSLRMAVFRDFVWANAEARAYLVQRYRHLIVDNVEEDTPLAHAVLAGWIPQAGSALILYDEEAGYRTFLGANWRTARQLADVCDRVERLTTNHVAAPALLRLGEMAGRVLGQRETRDDAAGGNPAPPGPQPDPRQAITFQQTRFHPQMLDWAVEQVAHLVYDRDVPPGRIVVLAPFVSDALRFAILNRMQARDIPAYSHRPSRALREESAAVALITLSRLMFPHWKLLPDAVDVMQTLSQVIDGLDLVRARLLVDIVYRPAGQEGGPFTTFERIDEPVRERITYLAGERFERLRRWLVEVGQATRENPAPLDHLFRRLFGEILSQPGFGFHQDPQAGQVVSNLIDSVRNFRQVVLPEALTASPRQMDETNKEYIRMLDQGVLAAQYVGAWALSTDPEAGVLIAPAYTYLISNRPVDYQVWLDAGSSGWWQQIVQPLTHPYVLAADYEPGRRWTDADEVAAQNERLYRLVAGLVRRCREHIFIANAEIGERGYEQKGRLLGVLQQIFRQLAREQGEA
ncbi:MAG: hypothetical protein ACE5H9_09770 [Anaerolineae bacterium]